MDFFEKFNGVLKEGVNKDEVSKELDAFITEQTLSKVGGLVKNRDDLLNEKKEMQKKAEELENKYKPFVEAGLDFDNYNKMKEELEALKAAANVKPEDIRAREQELYQQGKGASEKELKPMIEKLQKQFEMTNGRAEKMTQNYIQYRGQNAVVNSLKEMGVEYDQRWLKGLLSDCKFEYNEEEDNVYISVVHDKGMIPLDDWTKIFPETEEGQKMIKARISSGGGASGSNSVGGASKIAKLTAALEEAQKQGNFPLVIAIREEMAKIR